MSRRKINDLGYAPLHLHTDYGSVLDSMIKPIRKSKKEPCELLARASELNMPAVAITDHGSMAGVVSHYKTCMEYGIKPIIGCELYVTDDLTVKDKTSSYYHLIVLAKNAKGYLNLKRLSSVGFLDGFYFKPRVDFNTLKSHSEGLIVMTACLGGELPQLIMQENYHEKKAFEFIKRYKEVFNDDFYIELQSSEQQEQIFVNKHLVYLAEMTQTKYVITTDAHFINKEDFNCHNTYINISQNRDTENYKYCYLQSREEIIDIMSKQIGIVNTEIGLGETLNVSEKCDLTIELGVPKLPHISVPSQYKTEYDYLFAQVKEGFSRLGLKGKINSKEYVDRLKHELNVIKTKDFVGYFLILSQIIKNARERHIPIGTARGSAGGSLVAWCLGIIDIDPVYYNLDFGRFLTVERTENPDVDTDVSTKYRGALLDMIIELYGIDNVALVSTFGTLAPKAVIDSVGRVLNYDKMVLEDFKNKLSDSVSSFPSSFPTIYKEHRDFFDTCIKLEGSNRSYGTHAGAVCISGHGKPMVHYAPVMVNKDGYRVTQFEMHDSEDVSLVKYDFLGLSTLDYINDTLKMIGSDYYSFQFDFEDKNVYEMMSKGDNSAIFQLDSNFANNVVTQIKPQNMFELSDCIAIGRPDAIQFLEPYVKAKFDNIKTEPIHPLFDELMGRTYGCVIYQEQMMLIFKTFGGFSDGEADKVRKIIGKGKVEDLPQELDKFRKGAEKLGYSTDVIERIVAFVQNNISYSFNQSHSVAYAINTYKTAYLKHHYPKEYMCAVINNQTNYEEVNAYVNACKSMGIEIETVDINNSDNKFLPDKKQNKIYYGFDSIKGCSKKGIDLIFANRPFSSFKDFLDKVGNDLPKGDGIALIKAGAFNNLVKVEKIKLIKAYYSFRFDNKKETVKPISLVNKTHIKQMLEMGYISIEESSNKEYCLELFNRRRKIDEWKNFKEKYAFGTELEWEMEVLNTHLSGDPFEGVLLPDWELVNSEESGYIGGIITNITETKVKNGKSKGQKMCFMNISMKGKVYDLVVFSVKYQEFKQLIKIGGSVVVKATKQGHDKGVLNHIESLGSYLERTEMIQQGDYYDE